MTKGALIRPYGTAFIAIAFALNAIPCAAKQPDCSHFLSDFESATEPTSVLAAVSKAFAALTANDKLSRAQLAEVATALAQSEDGLTLPKTFWDTRAGLEWQSVRQLLEVTKTGLKNIQRTPTMTLALRESWRSLQLEQTKHEELSEEIAYHRYIPTEGELISYPGYPLEQTTRHFRFITTNAQEKITFETGSGKSVLIDFSNGSAPQAVDLGAHILAGDARLIGDDMLLDSAQVSTMSMVALNFENPARPTRTDFTNQIKEPKLRDFLITKYFFDAAYSVAPGKVILTAEYNNPNSSLTRKYIGHFIDSNTGTSREITQSSTSRELSGVIPLPEGRAFIYGSLDSVGMLDFGKAKSADEARIYWTNKQNNPHKKGVNIRGAKLLSDGTTITYDEKGNLVRWTFADGKAPQPTLLNDLVTSVGIVSVECLYHVFELAPGELLSLGEGGAILWDLNKLTATKIKAPKGISLAGFSAFLFSQQGRNKNVIGFHPKSGLVYFAPVAGQAPQVKVVAYDRSLFRNNNNLPIHIAPLDNGDGMVFASNGAFFYLRKNDEDISLTALKDLFNSPLEDSSSDAAVVLKNNHVVVVSREGKVVEYNPKLIRSFIENR